VDTVVSAPDDGWKYHPKYAEQFPDINKLCTIASCWIYIGILLGTYPILHISRTRVNARFIPQLTDGNASGILSALPQLDLWKKK
jgi:hypothetical protein